MLKRDALKIFDTNILDDYALSVQGSKIKLNEIPNHYRAATHMVLKYGCNWWKHIYLDSVGKCIMTWDNCGRVNAGKIQSIDLENDKVVVYSKNNPEGYQYYSISYYDMVKWVESGTYTLRVVPNY